MELETLKTLGQIAGIGGIAVGVLLIIFKSIIQKKIFPKLSPDQSYKIFRLIVLTVFLISVLGIVSWVYNSGIKEGKTIFSTGNKVTIIGKVVDSLNKPIRNAKVEIEEYPGIFNITDDNGVYVIELRGSDQRFVEFKVTHGNFSTLTNKVRIDFNTQPPEVNIPKFLMKIRTVSEKRIEDSPVRNASGTDENFNEAGIRDLSQKNNLTDLTILYLGDIYGCLLDLKIKIGDKTGKLTSNSVVIKGVPKGSVNYIITGRINCSIGICEVNSSNSIEIFEDTQLYLIWQNTLYATCEAYLSEDIIY